MADVQIERIVIKIGDKEIKLTLEEAKELKEILSDTFGERKEMVPYPVWKPYPVPYWPYPRWEYNTTRWSVTYGNSSQVMVVKARE